MRLSLTQAPHRLSATCDPDVLVVFITCNFISLKHVHHPAASSPSTHSLNPALSPPKHTMDFAPYQSESPEASRSFSRPLSPPARASPTAGRSYSPLPPSQLPPILPTHVGGPPGSGYRPSGWGPGDRETVNQFETSLPIRYVCAEREESA